MIERSIGDSDYRDNLRRTGVIDQLIQVLDGLYEEPNKPYDVMGYIEKRLFAPFDANGSLASRE